MCHSPDNHLFAPDMLEILLTPERWQLVSTLCPPDIAPVGDPVFADWRRLHSHAHPRPEIMIALCGDGLQGLGDEIYPRHAGAILFADAHDKHDSAVAPWGKHERMLMISLGEERLIYQMLSHEAGRVGAVVEWRRSYRLEELGLADAVFRLHVRRRDALPPLPARCYLIAMISLLLTPIIAAGYDATTPPPAQEAAHLRAVRQAQDTIRQAIDARLTVDALAEESGYSRYHFMRIFKLHTGITVHDFINQCRYTRYTEMHERGKSRKEIAAALGLSSPVALLHWLRNLERRQLALHHRRVVDDTSPVLSDD